MTKVPEALERMVEKVLAYHPQPKKKNRKVKRNNRKKKPK